ncbi:MAG: hypothetical protein VKK59_05895, partial [Vampirovibrionales bacterium]|nr:hypothetical protein [Vampirovibrionales bacterium]
AASNFANWQPTTKIGHVGKFAGEFVAPNVTTLNPITAGRTAYEEMAKKVSDRALLNANRGQISAIRRAIAEDMAKRAGTSTAPEAVNQVVNKQVTRHLIEQLNYAAKTMPEEQFNRYLTQQLASIKKNQKALFGKLPANEYTAVMNEIKTEVSKNNSQVNSYWKALMQGGHDASEFAPTALDAKTFNDLFHNPYALYTPNPFQTGNRWLDGPANLVLNYNGIGIGGTGQRGLALKRSIVEGGIGDPLGTLGSIIGTSADPMLAPQG